MHMKAYISITLGVEVGDVMTSKVVPAVHQDSVQGVISRGFLGLLEETIQTQVPGKLVPEYIIQCTMYVYIVTGEICIHVHVHVVHVHVYTCR